MTLEHDIETINEYMQWKAVRQDTSPEAFVRDRAQQTAYDRLSKGIEFMTAYGVENEFGKFEVDKDENMSGPYIQKLYNILNGTA